MKPPPPPPAAAAIHHQIHHLSTLLITPTNSNPITPLLNTHHPSLSLLTSHSSYDAVSSSLPTLSNWLYDSFHSSDQNLKLFVISLIPIISKTYLSSPPLSVFGIEPILLAISNSSKSADQNGPISIPDLSQQSIYHIPFSVSDNTQKVFKFLEPDIDPHWSVSPNKRAEVVGSVLGCYYKHISVIPEWSKIDFCKFVSGWAGQDCGCKFEFGSKCDGNSDNLNSGKDKIELPWEILQPVLRILGHCLLGPINGNEVKDAASNAVRCLYDRVSHDLVPSAILATRGLIQLDMRRREGVKKPDIDLVSN
uniref:uncharacterized protein LOC122601375 n=1 Tax=Erigeron canadensis TaxID=72917 RepID=UPI001CB893EF|nr:uncharacterized protein LOC122601375 [Erigeron canadensis]